MYRDKTGLLLFFCIGILSLNLHAIKERPLFDFGGGMLNLGIGNSSTAVDKRLDTLLSNPAGISSIERHKIGFQYADLGNFHNQIYIASGIKISRGIIGLGFRFFRLPKSDDKIKLAYLGNFSFSKKMFERFYLGLGLSLNSIIPKFSSNSRWQVGANIGTIIKFLTGTKRQNSNLKDLNLGISVFNLGNYHTDKNDPDKPFITPAPFMFRVGAAIKFSFKDKHELLMSTDINLPAFRDIYIGVGLEAIINNSFVIRTGGNFGSGLMYFCVGLGYRFTVKKVTTEIDYNLLPYSNWKTYTHYAGTTISIGTKDKTPPQIEVKKSKSYISPNYDGKSDFVEFDLDVKDNRRLTGWKLTILDSTEKTNKTYKSPDIESLKGKITFGKILKRYVEKEKEAHVPKKLRWEGENEEGQILSDGNYTFILEAWDEQNNKALTEKKIVIIDNTPPSAAVESDLLLFSPNNDGEKDIIKIAQACKGKDNWKGEIRDIKGNVVRTWNWKNEIPQKEITWDGKDDNSNLVNDGVYNYYLIGEDKAENKTEQKIMGINLTTKKQNLIINANRIDFSPNSDGQFDNLIFTPIVKKEAGDISKMLNWKLNIFDEDQAPIKTFSGKGNLPNEIIWDGKDNSGKIAADGTYFYKLNTEFNTGNKPESFTKNLILDRTPPDLKITSDDKKPFSPDGDRENDIYKITINLSDISKIEDWQLVIYENDIPFRTIGPAINNIDKTPPTMINWNGKSDKGKLLQSKNSYSFDFYVTDSLHNKSQFSKKSIDIDTTEPPIDFKIQNLPFSPDGDEKNDRLKITMTKRKPVTIKGYDLTIYEITKSTNGKMVQKIFDKANGKKLTSMQWTGVNSDGAIVNRNAKYKAVFKTESIIGNKKKIELPITIDKSEPDLDFKVQPALFSPDNDGENDILFMDILNPADINIKKWEIDIFPVRTTDKGEKRETVFLHVEGVKIPAQSLPWDGYGDNEELVESAMDYDICFKAVTPIDNMKNICHRINVDILVTPTERGLKIRISNIYFGYDSANLTGKNTFKILDRVSHVLKKYSQYQIIVEGHTDNIGSQEYNVKLSENRAKSVMQYLIKKGIDEERMKIIGMGFNTPYVPNDTEEGRAKNRRVEFFLIKMKEKLENE